MFLYVRCYYLLCLEKERGSERLCLSGWLTKINFRGGFTSWGVHFVGGSASLGAWQYLLI
jgi:hypothetical protein